MCLLLKKTEQMNKQNKKFIATENRWVAIQIGVGVWKMGKGGKKTQASEKLQTSVIKQIYLGMLCIAW